MGIEIMNALAKIVSIKHYLRASQGNSPEILTDIYNPLLNMAVWRRSLEPELELVTRQIVASGKSLNLVAAVTPQNALTILQKELSGFEGGEVLSADINLLVDMFCCLFEQSKVGLRLVILDSPMCPRFHVDKIPCRLVTTYEGIGTQWLEHQSVNRTKLGTGNYGLTDEQSGIHNPSRDIQQLNCGDVALLKGENWEGNEGAGLVHRSPSQTDQNSRLLLTLDFI